MKSNNILTLIKKQDIIIPYILISNRKKLDINEKELLFLSFLMSNEDFIFFDINDFCNKLFYDINDIMDIISSLEEKKLLEMITKKEGNVIREYISLNNLYNVLTSFIVEEEVVNVQEKSSSSMIFNKIEEEFGRPLSPIEFETIKTWIDSNVDELLISEALKEAVLNGVYNIKYIEKILYEWGKKGYKNVSDIKKKKSKQIEEKIDLFEYDWLDDNE